MTWKNNTPENLALARGLGREFASIIADGQREYLGEVEQGYGNYGTSIQFLLLAARTADTRT